MLKITSNKKNSQRWNKHIETHLFESVWSAWSPHRLQTKRWSESSGVVEHHRRRPHPLAFCSQYNLLRSWTPLRCCCISSMKMTSSSFFSFFFQLANAGYNASQGHGPSFFQRLQLNFNWRFRWSGTQGQGQGQGHKDRDRDIGIWG